MYKRYFLIIITILLLSACSGGEEKEKNYNVILISIDTLRYDHLNCNGYKARPVSPAIDMLAEDGVTFSAAFSPCPWTLPAHGSLFTGYYPTSLGLNYIPDPEDLHERDLEVKATMKKSLPEYLQEKGYNTWAFAGGGFVSKSYGFDKGFQEDVFYQIPTIEKTSRFLLHQLKKAAEKPFFIFLHNFDCHLPYRHHRFTEGGDEKILNFFADLNVKEGEAPAWDVLYSGTETFSDKEKETVEMLYDSAIHLTDTHIGSLCSQLKEMGVYDDTLIIVLSDHGEEFWDHLNRGAYHGHTLYNELLHVPLIIKPPADFEVKGGRVVSHPVSLVDVLPTILDFLGTPVPPELQGMSLKPLFFNEGGPEGRKIYGEAIRTGPERKSIMAGHFKLIISEKADQQRGGEAEKWPVPVEAEIELYNLENDPGERNNIASDDPARVEALRAELEAFFQKLESEKIIAIMKRGEAAADSDTVDQLRSLGYLN